MNEIKLWTFIKTHIEKDEKIILMVVVDSEHSSPGRAGFKMAVNNKKEMVGSIGGGKMEHDLVEDAVKNLNKGNNILWLKKLYHQGDLHEDSSGMICSGSQNIFAATLGRKDIFTIDKILNAIKKQKERRHKIKSNRIDFFRS